jgi:hypothetical protein
MSKLENIYTLSNCEIMRLDVDDEHFYYGGLIGQEKQYYVGWTTILDTAGPFPEGLRVYLRMTSYEESKERLESTGARGSKLHDALDRLAKAEELDLREYPTTFEKDAIVTFIQFWRFLNPGKFDTEMIVAFAKYRIAGTLDFNGFVEEWRLMCLMDPNKYLEVDSDGALQLKEKWLDLPNKKRIRIIIDWKFAGRTAYNHKVQVAGYKTMNNVSQPGRMASRAFIWRYSQRHKFRFEFVESTFTWDHECMWIYNTFISYMGEFPNPPTIRRYPDKVRLFEKVKK